MRGKLIKKLKPPVSVNNHSRTKTFHRVSRLASFTLIASLAGYLIVIFALAGIFAFTLTHPPCNQSPQPLDHLPQPEEHWLNTEDGLSVRSWYYPPKNGAAILALGGMSGSLGGNLPPVDFLVLEGFGVLQIDTRACARPPAVVTLGGNEVYDAYAGVSFLKTRPEVTLIGAFGFSMGGATVIRTAARHPEIAAVVAEGNYYNLGDHLMGAGGSQSFSERLLSTCIASSYWLLSGVNPWQLSPIDDLPRITPRPVFLIFGEHENSGAHAQAQYAQAGEPKAMWVVPGGGHGRNHLVSQSQYEEKILAFFNMAFFRDRTSGTFLPE